MPKNPTPDEVSDRVSKAAMEQPGLFGPAAFYAFVIGFLSQRDPKAVAAAMDAWDRVQASKRV